LRGREVVEEIGVSLACVERGFAKTTRWPSAEIAKRCCALLSRLTNVWASVAQSLIVATEEAHGILPMFAVENVVKPYELSRVDRALLVESINRPRQKRAPVDLLRFAMDWPRRASCILTNLAGDFGSLQLYGAYLRSIWTSVSKAARQSSLDVTTVLEHGAELLERDIAYPIVAGAEPLEAVVTVFEEAFSYDIVRKKRLSRQRERCLREGLVEMDEDWIDMLRDIGSRYRLLDEPPKREVSLRGKVSRGGKPVVRQ